MTAIGELLAPGYTVIEHLSRTRRLDTYEVFSDERACSCVAKTLRPDRRDDVRARAALCREGRLLTELCHPHVVRGYELLEDGPVAVMETLDGETVAHLLDRRPHGLDPDEAAWLGLQLASALRYLHARGLLHLDVKPANVIATAGRAVLIDLSLARAPGRYRPGLGTWCYLAPEQALGHALGPAADVWGLGTLLFEAVTGRSAFDDEDAEPSDSATWHTEEQMDAGFPQLEAPAPPATGPLGPLVASCLAFDPADRPTLPELAAELLPLAPGAHPWSD
jgi:eukaryotic-like serine/threonine-protein kinase